MVDDAILSREAAYIYQYAVGFEPIDGNLKKWSGTVQDSTGKTSSVIVTIPDDFPQSPPEVSLKGSTKHPHANDDGEIITRTISRWNRNDHVFSVIREAKSVLSSAPFTNAVQSDMNEELQVLKKQKNTLQNQLAMKKEEYENIQTQTDQQIASTADLDELIDEALIDLENESYAVEESYDNLELKAIEFAKEFVDVRRRYYLIEQSKSED